MKRETEKCILDHSRLVSISIMINPGNGSSVIFSELMTVLKICILFISTERKC